MKIPLRALVKPFLFFIIAWVFGGTSLAQTTTDSPSKTELTEALVEVPLPIQAEEDHDRANLLRMLKQKQYSSLNNQLEVWRKMNTKDNGMKQSWLFYRALSPRGGDLDTIWQDYSKMLKDWVAAEPKSTPAHLALAQFWLNYAWEGRSGKESNEVTPAQWKMFRDRLLAASEELKIANPNRAKYPEYFPIAQQLALGVGLPRDLYDKLYQEAIGVDPDNTEIYFAKAYFLQTRWFGKYENEWLDYLAQEATRIGGDAGDILYARVACRILFTNRGLYPPDQAMKTAGVSWPRFRQGMLALLRQQPESLWAQSWLCYYAVAEEQDYALARQLFSKLGAQVQISTWDAPHFAAFRAKAFNAAKN